MSDDLRPPDDASRDADPAPTTPAEDDVISAVLDGEATTGERAAVLADPRLRDRLRAFEHLRSATADAPGLDPASRDAAIARALVHGPATPTGAGHDELADRRADVRRRRSRALGAVAAVAVLLLAVPLLVVAFGDGSRQAEDAAGPTQDVANEAAGDAGALGAATDAPAELGDVGSFSDLGALRATIATREDAPAQSSTTAPAGSAADTPTARAEAFGSPPPAACTGAVAAANADLGAPTAVATATLDGEPVVVVVFAGEPVTIVVADAACRTIAREPS